MVEPGMPLAPWEPLTNWYDTKLEDILPHDGFIFKEGHKIFKKKQDWVRVKWAIEAPAPTLEEDKVDAALAAIMNDANIISNTFQQTYFALIDYSRFPTDAILESARKKHDWTEIVPDGRFPHLMKKLIRARTLYNRITWILGRSETEKSKQQGKLATAIDEWTRTRPTDDPEPFYARMPQYLKDYMISRLIEGKGADWNYFKGDHSDDEEPTSHGTSEVTKKKGSKKGSKKGPKKISSDENAPWVHTNYASNPDRVPESMEEEDDENAPWIPWSQTMRARQLVHGPTKEESLLSYRM
ncbi:hypothetical protein F5Y00DRAFT_241280 [Daldinia vernicosa]|uniref:uncharacterized protein n=1 Tax=Daldinia vernicosa TaxID=114800 RepID=UPI002008C49B|nr:uncharacterized protein F5Y00DRAFT_241280 [Daldinia vernicosa]KAI0847375.1 hypothetical protein F5Y00DRAFT_241280 [Daldinia vernicosa]